MRNILILFALVTLVSCNTNEKPMVSGETPVVTQAGQKVAGNTEKIIESSEDTKTATESVIQTSTVAENSETVGENKKIAESVETTEMKPTEQVKNVKPNITPTAIQGVIKPTATAVNTEKPVFVSQKAVVTAKPSETVTVVPKLTSTPVSTPIETPTPVATKAPIASEKVVKDEPKALTVTLTVKSDVGVILPNTQVEIVEGETVFDVLQKTMRAKGIQMESRGSGKSKYVEGINNIYEFDKGPSSGWVCLVDGVFLEKGTSSVKLKGGETILWEYRIK